MAKTPEEATAAAGDAPVKRGRGRPPKDGVQKKVYVPSGRPRGRPPTGNPKPAYVPTGKPRGRPKGSGKPASEKATPKPASGRGRGRPPAAAKAADAEEEEKTPATKRGARRPRVSDAVGIDTPASKRKSRGRKSIADVADEQLTQEDGEANADAADKEEAEEDAAHKEEVEEDAEAED